MNNRISEQQQHRKEEEKKFEFIIKDDFCQLL